MSHAFIFICAETEEEIQPNFVNGILPKEGDTLELVCTGAKRNTSGVHLEIQLKVKEKGILQKVK